LRTIIAVRAKSADDAGNRAVPVYLAAGLTVAHAASTVRAAGINWAIAPWQPPERMITDEGQLAKVFDRLNGGRLSEPVFSC
jgi:hypothetical protein